MGYGLKELGAFISNLYFRLLAIRLCSHCGGKEKLWVYEHMDKVLSSLVTPQLTLLWTGGWARDFLRSLPAWTIQSFCKSIIPNKVQKQYSNESWNLSVTFFQHILLIYLKTYFLSVTFSLSPGSRLMYIFIQIIFMSSDLMTKHLEIGKPAITQKNDASQELITSPSS